MKQQEMEYSQNFHYSFDHHAIMTFKLFKIASTDTTTTIIKIVEDSCDKLVS